MPLINYKVYFELNWIEDCILSTAGNSAKFEITDTKLHVSIVTLTTKGSANLTKQLSEGFKRSALKTCTDYLMHHFKVLKDYLFLHILLLQVLKMMKQV